MAFRKSLRIIQSTPAVDAVNVVRCKNCKFFDKHNEMRDGGENDGWCDYHWTGTFREDFCSRGREDDT